MKIHDIITEMTAGAVASVAMPMTPGTKPSQARKAVDPFGYGPNSKKARKTDKKESKKQPGYPNVIKRVYDEN